MKLEQHDWHHRSTADVLTELATANTGLTQGDVEARLRKYGANLLPAPRQRNVFLRFVRHFHNILIYVLIGAAVVTALLDHWLDTGVIAAVVLANAVIGFIQEGKAEKAMLAIRDMLTPHAAVLRDGVRQSIDSQQLVPGDIVLLEAGDKVPADLRLLTAHGLLIQEAILTGESVPVEKRIDSVAADAAVGDRFCMAYSGTMVTAGQAQGVVVATGAGTEVGRISHLMSEVETLTTPLVAQMNLFARWLSLFVLLIGAVLLVFGYFVQHYEFVDMFMIVVGLSVAAIPEGLPAVLTITLAVGVQEMARRNAIVRRLPAIETLGSVSVICTDKTGTLTRNEMMVTNVWTGTQSFSFEGIGYSPYGKIKREGSVVSIGDHASLEEIALAASLCNDASLRMQGDMWFAEGDPMEGALVSFSAKAGIDINGQRGAWPRVSMIPFNARHRFMATLNHGGANKARVFVKGAPETILAMCIDQRSASGTMPLDLEESHKRAHQIAAQGQRVLALAVREMPAQQHKLALPDVEGKLTFLGLVGMIDPPRPEAIAAVAECREAGIRVKMITGDHGATASAIGRQIGLQNADVVLTGKHLDQMDDAKLALVVMETDIFARTSPEHKLRLVTALQSHGLTVAMTGDGVNDAPALKRADAGIAMGKKGSEAAKEAAELVLVDDNFASIVAAVREGRTVYDNLKKVITWTLPTNGGEAMIIVVAFLLGLSLPITPIQILWINLITAVTLGLALAFEPTEQNTMRRPPRPRHEPLLTGGLVWQIVLTSGLFLCGAFGIFSYATDKGYSEELARTLVVNTLVVMEIFYLFFVRNIYGTSLTWKAVRGTKVVWATVVAITLAQFAVTYQPFLQKIFGTESVSLTDGLVVVGIGVLLFAFVETEKQIRLAFGQSDRELP